MQDLMIVTLTAMQRDAARLERVGNNIANQLTPGYKREILAERLSPSSASPFAQLLGTPWRRLAQTDSAPSAAVLTDIRPASLKQTGQPLDLAISGTGFFEIATTQGPAYTRRGQFQLDARGRLVTASGWPVIGHDGELSLSTGPVSVATDGSIRRGEQTLGQLRLFDADATTRLSSLGDGLYQAEGAMSLKPAGEVSIRQGFLEGSNVDTAHEMVQLLGAVRHFETMQRVTQGYDDMMSIALRKLGEL